ncbi:metal-sulfur cluster assembly factor [Balneolales bacterium ANBcel1]|nr:metal-sulfur cluster assembly factor [Balneolales bacterium ANBcel1]
MSEPITLNQENHVTSEYDSGIERNSGTARNSGRSHNSGTLHKSGAALNSGTAHIAEIRKIVAGRLREIIDPEIGINIVDLGLLYDIRLDDGVLTVSYNTTTPGCPLRRFIEQQIVVAVAKVPGTETSEVIFSNNPPWSVDMIAEHITLFRKQA